MKSAIQSIAVFGLLISSIALALEPVEWVNPLIGTGSGPTGYGGTMPLVTTPFGMTNWTAQTRASARPGVSYRFEDGTIRGFIGTHQPANWMGDYGYITLMPVVDKIEVMPERRQLGFTHDREHSTPYDYSVVMNAGGARSLRAEMTATDHCARMRFQFPSGAAASVVVEVTRQAIQGLAIVNPGRREISGFNPDRADARFGPFALPHFKGYFVAQFRQPFTGFGTFRGAQITAQEREAQGTNVGAYATFGAEGGMVVDVKVGTSFISIEQARANLEREVEGWDFERTRDSLRQAWNKKLGLISIEGASDEQRHTFFTALYHALLYPKLFSEHGRYYSAFDDTVHKGISYTAFSLWDTFRAEHSLLTLVAPERVGEMVRALLQNFQEGGWMPKWPNPSYTNIMIGTPADSVVAEALVKGFGGFNRDLAWQAVYKDAMVPPDEDERRRWFDEEEHTPYEARAGLTWSKKLGYIPADKTSESASGTLEESYDDWSVAQVARVLGREKDRRFFHNRSLHYKLLFNPNTGFMQARNSDGSWASANEGWTEGNQWDYLFAPLHDIPGVAALMGGREVMAARLDEYFSDGHHKHDNEPGHHYPYLYDFLGQPWKTQAKVRELARTQYSDRPDGMAGDDDCGQMSAWYVFAALGFYPVNPASAEYMIGSPLFEKAELKLPHGRRFTVRARNQSVENHYIQSARLNGRPLTEPRIRYADIVKGGTLEFAMGPQPSAWASDWNPEPLQLEKD